MINRDMFAIATSLEKEMRYSKVDLVSDSELAKLRSAMLEALPPKFKSATEGMRFRWGHGPLLNIVWRLLGATRGILRDTKSVCLACVAVPTSYQDNPFSAAIEDHLSIWPHCPFAVSVSVDSKISLDMPFA